MNAVIFPERPLGAVIANMGTQLADDGALRSFLAGQRHKDAAAFIPFPDNIRFPNLSDRFDNSITVTARMLEGGKRRADFIAYIPVPGRKLVAEDIKQCEVHLIGAVGIRRMYLRLDVRAIVEQDIKHEMALMLVCANVKGVDGHMVGIRRIGHDPFLQPPVFRGMASIERADTGLEFLAVAAGMDNPTNIIVAEYREPRNRVAENIIDLP